MIPETTGPDGTSAFTDQAIWHYALVLFLCWASLGGLALQTARGGRLLPALEVSEETRRAGRTALRRATFVALAATVLATVVFVVRDAAPLTSSIVLRTLAFATPFLTFFWAGGPLHRRNADVLARERAAAAEAAGGAAGNGAPGARSGAASGPSRRTATLVPRERVVPLRSVAWLLPALFVAAGPLALVVRSATDATTGTGTTAIVLVSAVVGGSVVVLHAAWAGVAADVPQDLSRGTDPAALDVACARFRRTYVLGVFAMAVLWAVAVAAVGGIAIAFDGDPARQGTWCGVTGGVLGGVVGCAGGVFGVLADRARRAIVELGGLPPEPGVPSPHTR